MTEDPGVMGNLPRSRPGRRSEKRAGADGAAAKRPATPKRATAGGAAARKTSARATRTATAGGARQSAARQRPKAASSPGEARRARGPDPVGDAVRLAAKVAGTGIGIASGILRRLPRP